MPYGGSLTPFMDKLDEVNGQFIATGEDFEDLLNTRSSPLDDYFLGVLDKHHGF